MSKRGGSTLKQVSRISGPNIQPNAAKQLFEILSNNGRLNQTRNDSTKSKKT